MKSTNPLQSSKHKLNIINRVAGRKMRSKQEKVLYLLPNNSTMKDKLLRELLKVKEKLSGLIKTSTKE